VIRRIEKVVDRVQEILEPANDPHGVLPVDGNSAWRFAANRDEGLMSES
jgi:hypothetical protein